MKAENQNQPTSPTAEKTCVICEIKFTGWGNNPEPVASFEEGRACDNCNSRLVLPARVLGFKFREIDALLKLKRGS